jgi:hypothetical protein
MIALPGRPQTVRTLVFSFRHLDLPKWHDESDGLPYHLNTLMAPSVTAPLFIKMPRSLLETYAASSSHKY